MGDLLWSTILDIFGSLANMFQVFRKIERQLPQLTALDLQYVSPKLLAAKDLELAVPGKDENGWPGQSLIQFRDISSR